MATNAELRLRFFRYFWKHLRLVWPIVSGLVAFQLALGVVIGFLERWSVSEMIYFTFVNRAHDRLWGPGPEARCLSDDCIGDRLLRHTADRPCRCARRALAPRGDQGRIADMLSRFCDVCFWRANRPVELLFSSAVGNLLLFQGWRSWKSTGTRWPFR